jgi:hypothetical protein
MGPDRAKQFMKKNADKIPAGENVLGVIIAEGKGGAWRRGLAEAAGSATSALVDDNRDQAQADERQAGGGDAARWPQGSIFWTVITDKQLHAFEGQVNSQNTGPGAVSYPLDRIARMDYRKKLLISKLDIHFTDDSSIELDVSKQKVQPFIDAVNAPA